jgi:hypothetical protein
MPTAKRTALVTGASGLAGGYMLAHLLEQGGWDIVAVSRRKPRIPGDYRYIAVDLLDPADCRRKLGPLANISHLFYLAITERSDPGETVSANSNMFFNLVKTVEAASPALEHVHLSQGTLYQCTDAALLAKAVEWMATDPKCANQAFNITNSDLIRWQNVWPWFANFFGMELAPPRHIDLTRSMADKGPIWDGIVEKNGLQKYRFEEIAAWGYPDGVFASDYDIVSDTSKARRFGFHDLVDTEEMFLRMFSDFRCDRIIP